MNSVTKERKILIVNKILFAGRQGWGQGDLTYTSKENSPITIYVSLLKLDSVTYKAVLK